MVCLLGFILSKSCASTHAELIDGQCMPTVAGPTWLEWPKKLSRSHLQHFQIWSPLQLMAEIWLTTWDGAETLINNGINYQPKLVSRISAINSITQLQTFCAGLGTAFAAWDHWGWTGGFGAERTPGAYHLAQLPGRQTLQGWSQGIDQCTWNPQDIKGWSLEGHDFSDVFKGCYFLFDSEENAEKFIKDPGRM